GFLHVSARHMAAALSPLRGSNVSPASLYYSSSSSSSSPASSLTSSSSAASDPSAASQLSPEPHVMPHQPQQPPQQQQQPFSPQSLAMMLSALARLRYRPPPQWMEGFLHVCRMQLPYFNAHAACSLAWALTRLDRPNLTWWTKWVKAFTSATHPLLPSMQPRGLCILLWSVSHWRDTLPRDWVLDAAAVGARQLREGAADWNREAAVLEAAVAQAEAVAAAAATAAGNEGVAGAGGGSARSQRLLNQRRLRLLQQQLQQELQQQQWRLRMRSEFLAILVWSLSRLVVRTLPEAWLAQADAATQALMRYSRAAAAASAVVESLDGPTGHPHNSSGSNLTPTAAAAQHHTLGPRELTMLLQGWARLRSPVSESCLSYALSYIEEAGLSYVEAAATCTAPTALHAVQQAPHAGPYYVGPQHVVLVLWSCAVAGWQPSDQLQRLADLHSRLLLLLLQKNKKLAGTLTTQSQHQQQHQQPQPGPQPQQLEAEAAGGPLQQQHQQQQQQHQQLWQQQQQQGAAFHVAQELVLRRQSELGMLVWALQKCGAPHPPPWFTEVLHAMTASMEATAAAAAAAAAAAGPAAQNVRGGGGGGGGRVPNTSVGFRTAAITLVTVATLARACLTWQLYPGDRWVAAAVACLDAGALPTRIRNPHRRTQLESGVRDLLEQLLELPGAGSAEAV
ncbi:hypothetical protein Agub_g13052, partial [Astrephomene gubernaculifera]